MKRKILFFALLTAALEVGASWYWPFGSDDKPKEPRVSELMEPASLLIDKASDFASDGKVTEAIDAYQQALGELNRIERENPERVEKPEFATVRNKRAYIEASINSLLLDQARRNANSVAVSDTEDLERLLKEEREEKKKSAERARAAATSSSRTTVTDAEAADRRNSMKEAKDALDAGDLEMAKEILDGLLEKRPNDAPALNMMAMVEMAAGDMVEAEKTLHRLMQSNPGVYYGYYNLARLLLSTRGDDADAVEAARRYYRIARDNCNGPADPDLEERLK